MRTEAKVISFANHKGGVGKTTTAASVGSILASKGSKVLLVDLDPQANLTCSLLDPSKIEGTVYDALTGKEEGKNLIAKVNDTLDIVPSSLELASADLELAGVMAREHILDEWLDDYKSSYEYILIDCPPSLGLLTLNAVTASDGVIIPLVAEYLPFVGLTMINNFIDMVKKKLNPQVSVLGILFTRFEKTIMSRQIEDGLRQQLGNLVFDTKIRKNITLAQAPSELRNIVDYDKKSNGAVDYQNFTEEFINRVSK